MPKPQPKQNFQIRRMFGLAKDKARAAGYDEPKEYLEMLAGEPLSGLTFEKANAVIVSLGGEPMTRRYSRRTVNYHRQQAGVKAVETAAHLDFMHELAKLRGMSDEGLERMGTRMLKHWPPRTTEEGNKIVEALKSMNKRDGITPPTSPTPAAAEPQFRRVP